MNRALQYTLSDVHCMLWNEALTWCLTPEKLAMTVNFQHPEDGN